MRLPTLFSRHRPVPSLASMTPGAPNTMSRRSYSSSPPPRATKRPKLEHLTSEDFKDGVFLAPMVRSGARTCCRISICCIGLRIDISVPTRLFALKHGASLVWGPETVDKAILHAVRVVDRESSSFFGAQGSSEQSPQLSRVLCPTMGRAEPSSPPILLKSLTSYIRLDPQIQSSPCRLRKPSWRMSLA